MIFKVIKPINWLYLYTAILLLQHGLLLQRILKNIKYNSIIMCRLKCIINNENILIQWF